MKEFSRIVRHSTNEPCLCSHPGCSWVPLGDSVEACANHMVDEHGYSIIHVGSETTEDHGKVFHHTVVVVGVLKPSPQEE